MEYGEGISGHQVNTSIPLTTTRMKFKSICLSILCLSLLLAVTCYNEKRPKDIEAEGEKGEQGPTISIDDYYFQEASQFSTPNEFLEKFGSPSIDLPWLSYPDKFEEGFLPYHCVITENNEIACSACGLCLFFIKNSLTFTLDAWEIQFPQMNTQSNFMPLNDLKQAMPLGTSCQQVRKILGQPHVISCDVVNASRSNEELVYKYLYLTNEIGMYQDRYALVRLLCTFANQKLSSVQMEFYEEMSLQALFDPERKHIEKY